MKKRDNEHTRSRYDLIAPIYDLMEWPLERTLFAKWRKELWNCVEGPKVLELGVGTGKNLPYYPNDIEITAVDLSPAMLERARKVKFDYPGKTVALKEMDAQNMDFRDDTFDEIVSTFVFCSVPDPVKGLQEALRVTKPGGKIYLLEHMRAENEAMGSFMDELDATIHYLMGVHIARETVQNINKAGWKILNTKNLTAGGIVKKISAEKSS